MPITKFSQFSAPFFEPQSDYSVGKYMDLAKFVSLLSRKSLFFCRYDKLEDQFEGTTALRNRSLRAISFKLLGKHFYHHNFPEDEVKKHVESGYEFERKQKCWSLACCWNRSEVESAALWKIYSDFGKGILIKSSINKLYKTFELNTDEFILTEMQYVDLKKDTIPDGNSFYPLTHKHKAYHYEDEVRLIYSIKHELLVNWTYDWTKEEVEEGKYFSVNLDELIEEIVIAPESPTWYFDLIKDLIIRYNLNKPVKKSSLSFD